MKNKNLEILMFGTIMGIFLGVMFAPKSGKRTREDIMDMMNDMKKMDYDDIKDCFDSKINEIEDELKDFDKEKVWKTAKKKAECMLQKADELVEEAMEKENEMFKEVAEDLRTRAIDVTKTVLDKLEKDNK